MRYILKAIGSGAVATDNLQQVLRAHEVHIVDGSMLPHMALVELDANCLPKLRAQLEGQWALFPEKNYSVPDTRRRIKK
jgi:hypothetical protein